MRTLVFNGWAAGYEAWDLCTFEHDWLFSYVEQLDGLPEKIMDEFDDVLLVGFSMGGSTALRMLLAYPEKVRGLVLVSSAVRMMEDPATGWKGLSKRRLLALKAGTDLLFGDDPSPIYAPESLARGLVYLEEVDLRAQLRALVAERPELASALPVRIFQSEKDGIVRPQNMTLLKEIFPQAAVTVVPGTEHVLPITIPELIDAAVIGLQEES